jgi:flagellar hook-basal body complex protein FliE
MTTVTAISSIATHELSTLQSGAPAGPNLDFARILESFAASATGDLKTAEAASIAGMQGGLAIGDVVEAVMQAERSLQTALAIRDKVVNAYLEMTRMQI